MADGVEGEAAQVVPVIVLPSPAPDVTPEAVAAPIDTVAVPLDDHIEQVVDDAVTPVLEGQRNEVAAAHERINALESELAEFREWRTTLKSQEQTIAEQTTPEALESAGDHSAVETVEVEPIAPPEATKEPTKKGLWLRHPAKKMRQSS